MNVEKLKALGRAAVDARIESPKKVTAAYNAAIEAIDAEIEFLKQTYPNNFVEPGSDEYKALAAQWAKRRDVNSEISELLKVAA